MFQLSDDEFTNLKSQIVTSSWGGPRRAKPYAFTEQGVAMLSSVLRSKRAVQVNIEIMRTFVRLRQLLVSYTKLAGKLFEMNRISNQEPTVDLTPFSLALPPFRLKAQHHLSRNSIYKILLPNILIIYHIC